MFALRKSAFLIFIWAFTMIPFVVSAQVKLSGKVTNVTDQSPVPSATIRVKGTERITQSDADGKFTIQANPGDVLLISHVSFGALNYTVTSKTGMLNIQLLPGSN